MRPRAHVGWLHCGLLLAAFLPGLVASVAADPALPTSWAKLELKGGRVLHNVRLMSNEPDSIVVRADEGLIKVAKSTLPQPVAALYPLKAPPPQQQEMAMQPFDPNPAAAVRSPLSIEKPMAEPEESNTHKGCTIVSFELKTFPGILGCAEVVVRNETDSPVEILPGDFACITTSRLRYRGNVMLIDGVPLGKKHKDLVPPHGDADELVSFTNNAIEISSVQWVK